MTLRSLRRQARRAEEYEQVRADLQEVLREWKIPPPQLLITSVGSAIRYSWLLAPFHYLNLFLRPDFLRALTLQDWLSLPLVCFGMVMPMIGASLGMAAGLVLGLGVPETALLGILSGSASYIAVPASMRLALPEASPGIYLTLSLAITFPFNLTVGIPLYFTIAAALAAP